MAVIDGIGTLEVCAPRLRCVASRVGALAYKVEDLSPHFISESRFSGETRIIKPRFALEYFVTKVFNGGNPWPRGISRGNFRR
jgi:hypothetical protein